MMEKACGPFPYWMAKDSQNFKEIFNFRLGEDEVRQRCMRIDWPKVAKNRESRQNWDEMKPLEVRIQFEYNF